MRQSNSNEYPQHNWAASWQNQKYDCSPSEDSDQPRHRPSLITVFAVRMKKPWVLSFTSSAQRRLWSDWAQADCALSKDSDWAQADLSLCWAHSHFVGFVIRWLICFHGELKKIILQLSTNNHLICFIGPRVSFNIISSCSFRTASDQLNWTNISFLCLVKFPAFATVLKEFPNQTRKNKKKKKKKLSGHF